MGQINIGTPIDTSLIQCCSCHKGYEIKGNLYDGNILICPHCGLKHKVDFKLIDKKIEILKKIDKLNLTAITIGAGATNMSSTLPPATWVDKNNPANETGKITSIEIYAVTGYGDLLNCEVGIFYVVSGNNLSTRSNVTLGTVTQGSKQTFTEDSESNPINMDVTAGDYIGLYWTGAGRIERAVSGAGSWGVGGDNIPCTNVTFVQGILSPATAQVPAPEISPSIRPLPVQYNPI